MKYCNISSYRYFLTALVLYELPKYPMNHSVVTDTELTFGEVVAESFTKHIDFAHYFLNLTKTATIFSPTEDDLGLSNMFSI